jgi:hypothetical protein
MGLINCDRLFNKTPLHKYPLIFLLNKYLDVGTFYEWHNYKYQYRVYALCQGWPTRKSAGAKKKILRPNLDLKSSKFPKVCKFALSYCGPKLQNFWQFFRMRPKDQFGLTTPALRNATINDPFHPNKYKLVTNFFRKKWTTLSSEL